MIEGPPPVDHAAPFRAVAAKIDLNKGNGFGGAFVIVTPEGAVHDLLLLDNAANAAMFWSLVETRAKFALEDLADQQDNRRGFGLR